jgi:hypothetical protein
MRRRKRQAEASAEAMGRRQGMENVGKGSLFAFADVFAFAASHLDADADGTIEAYADGTRTLRQMGPGRVCFCGITPGRRCRWDPDASADGTRTRAQMGYLTLRLTWLIATRTRTQMGYLTRRRMQTRRRMGYLKLQLGGEGASEDAPALPPRGESSSPPVSSIGNGKLSYV